ncbi:MAG: AbrB/MazE/SpoVT family DNA-binding domain-containing protein [Oscillospiraceae bacterium]|nr:AbrB/MazE/SpoVT family DNA-binding domain-containing protein [Oscillospiraceae bacterium]MBR0356160.1 AbrB/MazE/SpoVT family DNA-binding domain-containing protein [Clostridia bacterium]
MKATGIVRRIDELGRIVIPKEIRRTLRIQESDPLEIYMGEDGCIELKKYSSVGGLRDVAEEYVQALNGAFGLTAAVTDKESCVAAAGRQRRWLLDKPLMDNLRRRLLGRQVIEERNAPLIEGQETPFSALLGVPILLEGDSVGGVFLLSAEGGPVLADGALQSLKTGALYLGRLLNV